MAISESERACVCVGALLIHIRLGLFAIVPYISTCLPVVCCGDIDTDNHDDDDDENNNYRDWHMHKLPYSIAIICVVSIANLTHSK